MLQHIRFLLSWSEDRILGGTLKICRHKIFKGRYIHTNLSLKHLRDIHRVVGAEVYCCLVLCYKHTDVLGVCYLRIIKTGKSYESLATSSSLFNILRDP